MSVVISEEPTVTIFRVEVNQGGKIGSIVVGVEGLNDEQ
jgi:hypothetical protein